MNSNLAKGFALAILTGLSFTAMSQLTVNNGFTAQQLGNNLAGNNVNVFNASISGDPDQYGQFQFTGSGLGLNSGVILSTGNIDDAVGPNSSGSTSSDMGGPGNADLSNLAGVSTNDAVVFEFDFEVQGDEIEFNFVFLSEEYLEFVNSGFNDVFAFYISGPGIVGQQNLAVVPGTTTPVTINTINDISFWQFFYDNTSGGVNVEFDGFTTLMTAAKSGLQPCGIYTLSLRIADGSDSAYDSAVLLQENSLIQSNISASSSTFSANNTALEGCIEASFTFQLDSILPYNINIPIGIGGTATNGVDYNFIDNLITIPAGQLSATVIINSIAEGITEGQEVIELYYSPSPCQPQDTVLMYIDDYIPLEYSVTPTNVSCNGANDGSVDVSVSGGIQPYTLTLTDSITGTITNYNSFPVIGLSPGTYYVDVIDGYGCTANDIISGNIFDAGQTFIPDGQGGSYSSTIYLGGFGAGQTIQSPDQIQSICATMEHSRIGELEITLTAPDGNSIILKQQPGGSVTNMGEPCAVGPTDGGNSNTDPGIGYNYCWQPISTYGTMVAESNSYTYQYLNICDLSIQQDKYLPSGSYQPYESFSNFIGSPLNGGWSITVSDAIPNNNGYIFDWSITLQADLPDSIFTITEPQGPGITHISTSPNCGGNNGSINLSVTGGAPPFTYLWSNGATTQDITNLTSGIYTVDITDDSSCVHSYQVNLSSNGSLVLSGTATDELCYEADNGSINLGATGGTAPISYSWSNGAITQDISNLSPGSYTVTVNDGAGCQGITSFNINAAPAININASITNENCGDAEGIIDITVYGVVAPVVYSWNNGASTEDIDELIQGNYIVNLTDANGCSAVDTFGVINLVGNCIPNCDLEITNAVVTNEACGNAGGSINLTVFTTNGPAQYLWNNGALTQDLFMLSSGTYSVTISDNEGCTVDSVFALVNQTGNLAITGFNVTNENCGNGQGALDATISGGVLPYTYSWNNGATTQDLSSLSADTYTLTVTDGNGCSVYQTATVSNISGSLVQTYGNAVDEVCNNSAGSIDIQISGGQQPYSYQWSNGASSQDLLSLSAGNYSCVITDVTGCAISTPVYVVNNQSGSLAISSIDLDNEVCGNGLGEIEMIITGGALPYAFSWNTGATTQDIFNLTAGTYSATITDNNGCSVTTGNLQIINESGTLDLTDVSIFDEVCGNGLGSINVTITGGTAPISYLWNTGSTSQDLTNLSAGTYTCTITDVNGCQVFANGTVSDNQGVLNIDNIVVANENCGDGSGALNLIISGATAPIVYSWSNGASTEDLTNLNAGVYTVLVTDNNGCSTNGSASVSNITTGVAVDNVQLTNELCGANDGGIDITISGGIAPISFVWSSGQTTEDLSGVGTGSYSCTITDGNGCVLVAGPYSILNSSGSLNASLVLATNESCNNNSGTINISVSGGTAPYSYSWSNGASTEDLSGLSEGNYSVIVTDQNGCSDQLNVVITNESGSLTISAISITDEVCGGLNGAIDLSVSGGTPTYSYLWSNATTTQDLTALNNGIYSVTVTDVNGCQVSSGPLTVGENSGAFTVTGINVVNEVCGDGMGNVDLIVAGAGGSVLYNWSNGATTQDLNMVSAGVYSGTAVNVTGCTISFSAVVMNEPGNLSASAVNTAATCNQTNGAIDLTVSGATNPVSYIWSNGATTEDIAGLSAGNYICSIVDGNGCSLNFGVAVPDESGPQIAGVTSSDETCGNSNGSITLNVLGGTAPLTYVWSGPPANPCCTYTLDMQDQGNTWNGASIDVMIDGVLEGNYTVPGGGANTETFSVCNGETIELIWNPGNFDNEVSFDLLDASGAIVFSQGADPTPGSIYTGTASCAVVPLSGNSVSGLSAGTYSVVVTDANGCEDSVTVILNNTSGNLQITGQIVTDETCSDANGSIDLTVNGAGPFTYLWSNGGTTQDLSSLAADTYEVSITDQNGCNLISSYTLTNYSNGLTISSSTIIDENCGDGSGSISINPIGGSGPLSFLWSNGFTAQNISGLSQGTYTVIVSDGSVCDYNESFVVGNQTGGFTATAAIANESCTSANGSIDQTISGGTAPYTFLWNTFATTEDLTSLSAGNYSCSITDAAGCSFVISYSVLGTNNGLTTSANITDEDCGNVDGAINLSVSGGSSPYSYLWSNGATTQDLINLGYGNYTVTVTDANGCSASSTYNVASEGNFNITGVTIVDATCTSNNGSINLSFGGFNQPQDYLWSNGETTQDISNLSSGWYTVEMSTFFGPGGGCTMVDSFFVDLSQGTLWIDSLVVLNETCSLNDGSITSYISGGTAPYAYSWNTGDVTEDLNGLSGGAYQLTVTDNNGCTVTANASLSNYTFGFGVTAGNTTDENCGDGTGTIEITVTGGTSPYVYSWNNGESTEDLNSLNAGTYTVIITDATGCEVSNTFIVNNFTAGFNVTSQVTDETCGNQNGAIELSVIGGVQPITFAWNSGETTEDLISLSGGSYSCTITDATGCVIVVNEVLESFSASFDIGNSIVTNENCGDATGSITLNPTGGTAPLTYDWTTPNPCCEYTLNLYDLNNNGWGGNPIPEVLVYLNGSLFGNFTVPAGNGNSFETVQIPVCTGDVLEFEYVEAAQNQNNTYEVVDSEGNIIFEDGPNPFNGIAFTTSAVCGAGNTNQLTGLSEGSYSVSVTDFYGCVVYDTLYVDNITNGLDITSVTIVDETCQQFNGSIDIEVGGGDAPYIYSWNTGSGNQDQNGLGAGNYSVSVMDNTGCIVNGNYVVNNVGAGVDYVGALITDATCSTCTDGAIDISLGGASAPYTFDWSTNETTEDISGLIPGIYAVTITNVDGCDTSLTFEILDVATLNELNAVVVQIHPNPSEGIFYLSYNGESGEDLNYKLLDAAGRLILQSNSSSEMEKGTQVIDLSEQSPGTYLLKGKLGEHDFVYRLIKW